MQYLLNLLVVGLLFCELLVISLAVGHLGVFGYDGGFAIGFGTFIATCLLCYFLPRASAVLMGIIVSIIWNDSIAVPPEGSSDIDIVARYAAAFLAGLVIQLGLNDSLHENLG
jgi:hypothetical protein